MNYFQHNDSRGMKSRLLVEANRAERAKAQDFDGTLYMSRYEVRARCNQARCVESAYVGTNTQRTG